MSRLIHVLIIEEDNPDCFSIGVIDNITVDCEESFRRRLKVALDEHFDADTEIVGEFLYTDLFGFSPVTITVKVGEDVGVTDEGIYKIKIAETWLY